MAAVHTGGRGGGLELTDATLEEILSSRALEVSGPGGSDEDDGDGSGGGRRLKILRRPLLN